MPGSIYDSLVEMMKPATDFAQMAKGAYGQATSGNLLPKSVNSVFDMMAEGAQLTPALGMAKVFKPGANTLEGLVNSLVKNGETLPSRGRMLPSIHLPSTGEIFSGDMGGSHPTDLVSNILMKRGQIAGGYTFGYRLPQEGSPFIHESIANQLMLKDGPAKIQRLLNQGVLPSTIANILQQGRVF